MDSGFDRHFLFNRTADRVKELEQKGKRPLLLWDDSRIEKHESWVCEGLCSVLSSKEKRLTRIRRGFFYLLKIASVYLVFNGLEFFFLM